MPQPIEAGDVFEHWAGRHRLLVLSVQTDSDGDPICKVRKAMSIGSDRRERARGIDPATLTHEYIKIGRIEP